MTRHVTADQEPREAFELYRLCPCDACSATGKQDGVRCPVCRGEARTRELVASATDAESVGVALITLGREGEWEDCPIGILEVNGEPGRKWLVKPWQASAREVSAAGRILAQSKSGKGKS